MQIILRESLEYWWKSSVISWGRCVEIYKIWIRKCSIIYQKKKIERGFLKVGKINDKDRIEAKNNYKLIKNVKIINKDEKYQD